MLKKIYKTVKIIEYTDWNDLVFETYGKPYDFQQQDGCVQCGVYELLAYRKLSKYPFHFVGMSLKEWLALDPPSADDYLSWVRTTYPDHDEIAHDLCKRGLLPSGEYLIIVD